MRACYHRAHGPARLGVLARHRRPRCDQDLPLGMAAPPRDGRPARRLARGPRGAIFGLLGPNGAGKTTLLSILATLLVPDGGQRPILGHDVSATPRRCAGASTWRAAAPRSCGACKVEEIIAFYGRLYGLPGARLRRRVERADRAVRADRLPPRPLQRAVHRAQAAGGAGQGARERPRAALPRRADARASIPTCRCACGAHVADLRRERGITIVLTTHYMREAEELCDEIGFIKARPHPGPRHRRRAQAPDRPRRRDRAAARSRRGRTGWPSRPACCAWPSATAGSS